MRRSVGKRAIALLFALASSICVLGFYETGLRYQGFRLPYGVGVYEIPGAELVFYGWLLLFGIPAVAFASRALGATALPGALWRSIDAAAARPRLTLLAAAALLFAACLLVRQLVLQGAPIADDESAYAFIARTLLHGRLVNPSPGDSGFFANQFVIADEHGWFGKYPIGHPALLALGEALGLRSLVVPSIAAASLVLTWALGRRLFPEREALLGALLLLVSPHFVFTGATQLSQPASCLFMLLAMLAVLRLEAAPRPALAAGAGAAFAAGILVRPLPGLLFLLVGLAYAAYALRGRARREWLALGLAAAAPLVVGGALALAVNSAQTGSALVTGYQRAHGRLGVFENAPGRIAASIGSSLLRQNFWLFGWPLSLAFLPFARRSPRVALLWGMVGAAYAYRVIAPKAVVASTGPIYVTEIVPLLALASASGMARLAERMAALGVQRSRERVAAVALAATAVAALTFIPIELRELRRSGDSWQTVFRMLRSASADRAVVFSRAIVEPGSASSWAYYPPSPSPDLDDEFLFLRLPRAPNAVEQATELWQRRFPERSAWLFRFERGEPQLHRMQPPQASLVGDS